MANRDHQDGGGAFEDLHRRNLDLMRQVDRLSALREISLAVSASLDLAHILRIAATVVQGALELRRLTIYELDEDGETFRPVVAKYGDDLITRERLEEDTLARRGSTLGEAIDANRVVLDNGADRSAAYVPLVAQSEALGVMLLEDRNDGLSFDDDDAELFRQLGAQIAVAFNNARLYALAVKDGLTRLFVRRYFDLRMEEEFAKAKRYGRPFSLLLFDIDHFKVFNDTYGHQMGDLVLRQFARLLHQNTRDADICCRYGGEEMGVILPETPLQEAAFLGNKLCRRVRDHDFGKAGATPLKVTTSVGVVAHKPDFGSPAVMVAAADAALYAAKDLGRNRAEVSGL